MTAEKQLRVALALEAIGLAIEAISLMHLTALSFVAFTAIGLPFIAAGAVLYLWAVLRMTTLRSDVAARPDR